MLSHGIIQCVLLLLAVTLDCLEQREPAFLIPIAYSVLSFYTGSCLHLVPLLLQWMRR
jgi:hypothetical protein